MEFNFKKDPIFKILKIYKIPIFQYSETLKKFLKFIFCLSLFLYFLNINRLEEGGIFIYLEKTLILSFGLLILIWYLNLFFENQILKNNESIFDLETGKILHFAFSLSKRFKLNFVSDNILLFSILKINNKKINFIFKRGPLNYNEILKEIWQKIFEEKKLGNNNFEKIIEDSIEIAEKLKKEKVGVGEILSSLAINNELFKNFLLRQNLDQIDLQNLYLWQERIEKIVKKSKQFWEKENLLKIEPKFNDISYSFTITLDKFTLDWKELIRKRGYEEIFGRKTIVEKIETILEKESQNDVLIVGEPDVGRKSILHFLAQKIFLGQSTKNLNGKRILELDVLSIFSQSDSKEMALATLDKCFQEAAIASNVIIVIDDIHNFLQGDFNITGVLTKYLPILNFRIIGITTFDGFHTIIERKQEISSYFEKVEIPEISKEDTLLVLENYAMSLETIYKKFITYTALKEIIKLTDRYLPNQLFPKKAIEILQESVIFITKYSKNKVLLAEHIQKIISEKAKIPVGEIKEKEKEILLNLENLIHQKIINQEEAVFEISSALRRARTDIQTKSGPIGTFLFLGPTGVGKTETAKALSEIYFGDKNSMIRLDMSEFQHKEDIKRLIGSETEEGILTNKVKDNPFSLILLDEFEKANKDILNLFLQVFDEGYLSDNMGRKVSFKNTIIIATSNAGAEIIREDIEKDKKLDIIKTELLDWILKNHIFTPELINRFDGVIIFKPLTKENLLDIAHLLLDKLKKNLKEKGIEFQIHQELKEKIVELSYNPQFGAREMRRTIQNTVENSIANAILSDKIKKGDKIKVSEKNFEVIII